MTEPGTHDRESFEAQGSAFLRQNISDKPEFDYAENRPPHSFDLAGKTLTLAVRDSPIRYRHVFGAEDVEIEALGSRGAERRSTCPTRRSSWPPTSSSSRTSPARCNRLRWLSTWPRA